MGSLWCSITWVVLAYILQVLLTKFRSLPPLFEDTPNAVHELTLASKILYSITFYRYFLLHSSYLVTFLITVCQVWNVLYPWYFMWYNLICNGSVHKSALLEVYRFKFLLLLFNTLLYVLVDRTCSFNCVLKLLDLTRKHWHNWWVNNNTVPYEICTFW